MLKGSDIIIFGAIDWNMQWQWQQELAIRLSKENRVVFVENTGVRSIQFKDTKRIFNRVKNFFGGVFGFKTINKNLVIFSPIFFPFPYNKFFIKVNSIIISLFLKSWTENLNFNPKYIFSFISTPLIIKICKRIPHDHKVFIYTDKMSKSSPGSNQLSEYIGEFAKSSNICFYSADDLKRELKKYNKKLFYFPGGVDFSKFNKKISAKKKKKNIIGYIGQVKDIIDFKLISKIAKKFQNSEIQIIGPIVTDINEIEKLKNVKFFGSISHDKIPNYVRNFDVGIIPYIKNEYTNNISPAKLNEYLSLGLPCVSTDLNEIKNFNKQNNNVVDVSKNDGDFLKKIKKNLNMDYTQKKKKIAQRIKISRKYDWKKLFERFKDICEQNIFSKNLYEQKNWEQGLNILNNQFKKIFFRVSAYILILYSILFFTPLAGILGKQLAYFDKIEKSDAILVVSGTGSLEYLNTDFQSRYADTLRLYNQGFAKDIIIMKREHNSIEEGDLIKKLLMFQNVPEENIIVVDKEFSNTFTNYVYINKYYLKDYNNVILSTSSYHSLRSKLIFDKISNKKILISKSPNEIRYKSFRIRLSISEIRIILREYIAIIYAYFRGWI